MKDLSEENFNAVVRGTGTVVVDFFSPTCGPCKQLLPVVEELSREMTDVTFAKMDVTKAREIAEIYNIRAVPTVIIFKDGLPEIQKTGFMPKSKLKGLIESA